MSRNDEVRRIRDHYLSRDSEGGNSAIWTFENPVVVHIAQELERKTAAGLLPYWSKLFKGPVLDAGCGAGNQLLTLLKWGVPSNNLHGVDLSEQRLRNARDKIKVNFVEGELGCLPYASGYFKAIFLNVVMSSIVQEDYRFKVARELDRILDRNGILIWYDARKDSGRDPHFRSVGRGEVESLFPGLVFDWRNITTDMRFLKRAEKIFGHAGMTALDMLPFLKTHLLGIGRRRVAG